MRVVYTGGEGEITEKKSRFIATVKPVQSEEEAVAFINETKKKYWDARHNCSAFVIGDRQEMSRCSDDGEPAQTAGRPMLDVLLREDIHNVAVVVTRYFGGVLLGTGGLYMEETDLFPVPSQEMHRSFQPLLQSAPQDLPMSASVCLSSQ